MADAAAAPSVEAIRNMLLVRIRSCNDALSGPSGVSDENVHTARKELKAARATLRLLRGIIGDRRYALMNTRLRDAARPLSRVRDAAVLLDTVAGIHEKTAAGADRAVVQDLEHSLRNQYDALRVDLARRTAMLKTMRSALTRADRTVARWPLAGPHDALAAAVERLYRNGRKALRQARAVASDESLHDLRKQAKYLTLALEALESVDACRRTGAKVRARTIGEDLGADHDLALIRPQLAEHAARLQAAPLAEDWISAARKSLQRKALSSSSKLYGRKAAKFVDSLAMA